VRGFAHQQIQVLVELEHRSLFCVHQKYFKMVILLRACTLWSFSCTTNKHKQQCNNCCRIPAASSLRNLQMMEFNTKTRAIR
jgi:hypothetical protein